jgi:hypothetical protein
MDTPDTCPNRTPSVADKIVSEEVIIPHGFPFNPMMSLLNTCIVHMMLHSPCITYSASLKIFLKYILFQCALIIYM